MRRKVGLFSAVFEHVWEGWQAARKQVELTSQRFPGEEREIQPLLHSIESDIAHRTQLAQDRKLQRQRRPARQVGRVHHMTRGRALVLADL